MSAYDEDEWPCVEGYSEEDKATMQTWFKRRSLGRANPLSPEHKSYQRAVNRWFAFALLCAIATAATVMGGWRFVMHAIGLACLAFLTLCLLVWFFTVCLPGLYNWLNGE